MARERLKRQMVSAISSSAITNRYRDLRGQDPITSKAGCITTGHPTAAWSLAGETRSTEGLPRLQGARPPRLQANLHLSAAGFRCSSQTTSVGPVVRADRFTTPAFSRLH